MSQTWQRGTSLAKVVRARPNYEESAWIGHLPFANWIIQKKQPKTLVELGTHTGASYFSFCDAVIQEKLPTRVFAVDTWQGDEHAGFYGDEVFGRVQLRNEIYQPFSTLLRMEFDAAVSHFEDASIELLHIDGLHTYEAVKHDFETWRPKLSEGAIVLFHDTQVTDTGFGVKKFWEEVSSQYPNIELLHSFGLGILEITAEPAQIIPTVPEERAEFVQFFKEIGQIEQDRYASAKHRKTQEIQMQTNLENLQHQLESVQQHRIALLNSFSWRVTKPVRSISKIFLWRQ